MLVATVGLSKGLPWNLISQVLRTTFEETCSPLTRFPFSHVSKNHLKPCTRMRVRGLLVHVKTSFPGITSWHPLVPGTKITHHNTYSFRIRLRRCSARFTTPKPGFGAFSFGALPRLSRAVTCPKSPRRRQDVNQGEDFENWRYDVALEATGGEATGGATGRGSAFERKKPPDARCEMRWSRLVLWGASDGW